MLRVDSSSARVVVVVVDLRRRLRGALPCSPLVFDPIFAAANINGSDFAILANLCRSGDPYQLTQRDLMDSLRLTSGTISVRIDHLS